MLQVSSPPIGLHHPQRAQRLARKAEAQTPRGRILRRDRRPQNFPAIWLAADWYSTRMWRDVYASGIGTKVKTVEPGARISLDQPVEAVVGEVPLQIRAFPGLDAQRLAPRNCATATHRDGRSAAPSPARRAPPTSTAIATASCGTERSVPASSPARRTAAAESESGPRYC